MLLTIITALSAAAAVLGCWLGGVFGGLGWLIWLPLGFVGAFLGWLVLAFLFLWLACAVVRLDRPQEHDSKFYRRLTYVYIDAIMTIARVRVHPRGLEKTPKDGRFLLVCNHLCDVDPAILLAFFKKSQLAFISKRENSTMFLVGKIMHKLLCQLVNRENDREALKTILKCIQLIKEDEVSIGVFPEGYVSKDSLLRPFRPGVFKIAQRTKVPIVVCTLQNTRQVLCNLPRLKPTDVELHLVAVIEPQQYEGMTTVQIADLAHSLMAADLGPDLVYQEGEK